MANNRDMISDSVLVRPPQLLERGLLPGLGRALVVDEGWNAVITEGGAFKEVLGPGQYYLSRFSAFLDVKSILVDMRVQNLTVKTVREFTISQPVPVQTNLDLGVEYRVSDPRRVALETSTPVTSLYDRVIQAVSSAVSYASIEEVRTQGEGIARTTLERLHAMQLSTVLGLWVLNVQVTSIKAVDTAGDAVASQLQKEWAILRDWQLQSLIDQNSQVTEEWLIMHRPELYAHLRDGDQELLKVMIEKGLLDPASILAQGARADATDPTRLLTGLRGSLPGMNRFEQSGTGTVSNRIPPGGVAGQLPGSSTDQRAAISGPDDIHARMREEISYLEKIPGAQVEMRPGTDDYGIPDGSYEVRVEVPRPSGGTLTVYFICSEGYPTHPPSSVELDLDGQATAFEASALRHWSRHYLAEIVREARQRFG